MFFGRLSITVFASFCFLFPPVVSRQPVVLVPVCNVLSKSPCATAPELIHADSKKYLKKTRLPLNGEVVVQFRVEKDGTPRDLQGLKSTSNELTDVFMEMLRHARFSPATFEGVSTAVQYWATWKFHGGVEAAFQLSPTAPPTVSVNDFNKLFSDASQAYNRREYQTAISTARHMMDLAPFATRVRLVLAESLMELTQFDEAEAALADEIKLEPKSPFAYNLLGRVCWREHKYDEALARFRKQIEVNPEDHSAYQNAALLLRDERRCAEAIPELEKALVISPKSPLTLLTHGECNVALGNTAKGMAELEQATSTPSTSNWNRAAYWLAEHNVELDRAQKWSEKAIATESAQMLDISIEHLTPNQLGQVSSIAYYWDTMGWIDFRRGDLEKARAYIEAAWSLRPLPSIGGHLGQLYEKLGRHDEAVHTYAMPVAAVDLPTRMTSHPLAADEVSGLLTKSATFGANVAELIKRGRTDLEDMRSFTLPNESKSAGSADFILKMEEDKTVEVRQKSGDASLAGFAEAVRNLPLAPKFPGGTPIEIVRRATLICSAQDSKCRFTLLRAEEAYELALKEANYAAASSPE